MQKRFTDHITDGRTHVSVPYTNEQMHGRTDPLSRRNSVENLLNFVERRTPTDIRPPPEQRPRKFFITGSRGAGRQIVVLLLGNMPDINQNHCLRE